MLVLVTEPARCGSFMLEGSALMGLGRPAEGADGGGNCLLCGNPRGGHLALCRRKPLVNRAQARIVPVPLRCQLANPRVDSVEALPDLLGATLRGGSGLADHALIMLGLNRHGHA
jgi:hypothetical protein